MKRLIAALIIFTFIVVGGGFILYMRLPKIVANLIAEQTKTAVSIEKVTLRSDGFSLRNLTIYNPEGSQLKTALKAKEIAFTNPYTGYFKRPLHLNRVLVQDIYLGIEFYNEARTEGNWITIMNRLNTDAPEEPQQEGTTIRELLLRNISVELQLHNEKIRKLSPIPEVRFDDVRTDSDRISQDLTRVIIRRVMRSVFLRKGIQTIISLPKDVLDTIITPFRWFGGKRKSKENGE